MCRRFDGRPTHSRHCSRDRAWHATCNLIGVRRFLVILAAAALMAPAVPLAPAPDACPGCCHHQDAIRAADQQAPACCRLAADPPRSPARQVDTRQAGGAGPRAIDAVSHVDTSRGAIASRRLSDRHVRHMRLVVIRI
jgi:hypothetical protein